MRPAQFHCRILSGLLLAAAGSLRAAPLEIGSPFLPSSGAPSTTALTAGAPIELHGYMVTPAGEAFSIYDPSKKSAAWVKVNETGYPFVVRSHKIVNSNDQITVDYQGSTLTLALKQSKIASAAQAGGLAAVPGFAGRGGAGGGFGQRGGGGPGQAAAAAVVPTAEEATRLQAAAADFQQRQAQRQQAQAALQAGQALQPVAPAGQIQGVQRGNGGQQNGQGNGGGRRAQRAAGQQ
jgi:hypothetical protein